MTHDAPMRLGVCYYPEHWPEAVWADDARRMVDAGLSLVRIGEFAWSRLEPAPGDLRWDWLDRAMDALTDAGLEIVLGTPTATPPRWMLTRWPDMLAVGADGRERGFGSRRHYCFAHLGYREEGARIAGLLGARYGRRPALAGWQLDNEYGCHDTTLSTSAAARAGFRGWLRARYGDVDALNAAWGAVFWSMEVRSFDEIDFPLATVTDPNPAHALDYRRFMSDQVVAFNRAQADALRPLTDAPLVHNYMGRVTEFDHHAVGADLDVASWDSYPLGFLEDRVPADAARRDRFCRTGDPDFQAFHHDLYRGVGRGRWWVMEQQPGPVNWAPTNPTPAAGAVRLWTFEALAHGAEAVLYFRWRQAPFGQEQMHAGLLRPDGAPAPALDDVASAARALAGIGPRAPRGRAPVALLFDYEAQWASEIERQGAGVTAFELVFEAYRAVRSLGLDVDVVGPDADLSLWPLVLAPGAMIAHPTLAAALSRHPGVRLIGPRSLCKTPAFRIPERLPPDLDGRPALVARVDAPPLSRPQPLANGAASGWIEELEPVEAAHTLLRDRDGAPILVAAGSLLYLGARLDQDGLRSAVRIAAERAGLSPVEMPDGVRLTRNGAGGVLLNYGETSAEVPDRLKPLFGSSIGPVDVIVSVSH